jgi:hypothetical protein
MSGPRDRHHDEADHERHERRPDLGQRVGEALTRTEVRDVDLEHEQRQDDREDAVRQRQQPGGFVEPVVASTLCFLVHRFPLRASTGRAVRPSRAYRRSGSRESPVPTLEERGFGADI